MHTQRDIYTSHKSQACKYIFSNYGANLSTSPGQAEHKQSAGSESRKANKKRQENRMQKPMTKVDEAVRLCLVQWHLYAIGIAHKGSFNRLTMANLLRSAQQTRNSHKKTRHSQSTIWMAEELPLQCAREAESTDACSLAWCGMQH